MCITSNYTALIISARGDFVDDDLEELIPPFKDNNESTCMKKKNTTVSQKINHGLFVL